MTVRKYYSTPIGSKVHLYKDCSRLNQFTDDGFWRVTERDTLEAMSESSICKICIKREQRESAN